MGRPLYPLHSELPRFPFAHGKSGIVVTTATSPPPHRGWHSRGYLPHWDHPDVIQSLSLRLSDSLPASVLVKWRNELALAGHSKSHGALLLRCRIERFLDAGHGECWLSRPELARLVEEALSHFDGQRYHLLAWCIMPNHLHVLIETATGHPLAEVMHSWKSYTGTKANQILSRRGEFWQREYLDRFVRDVGHYQSVIAYIEDNPVKAGLARTRMDWPWSSARFRSGSAGILAGESRVP